MKILQINKAYYPHLGGIETVVQQLAEGLVQREDFSVKVLACNTTRNTTKRVINDVSVTYSSSLTRVLSLPISPSFIKHLAQHQADILHLHEPFPLGDLAYLAVGRKRFKRLFIWWHSDIIRQRIFYILYAPLIRRVLHHADGIVVATPHHITSSQFLPDFKEKCYVIHYGLDVGLYQPTSTIISKANQLRERYGTPLILFVGRLVYYKGVEYLIEAMQYLPKAQLVLVGNGPLKSKLEALARQYAPNQVNFLPPQEKDDLIALYHACDIFVLPSVANSEQFGIVQVEAMLCGKPVVSTNLPTGVSYVNRHQKSGLLVPPSDTYSLYNAIQTLLSDNILYKQYATYAQQYAQNEFALDDMIDKIVSLYQ